MSIVSAFKVLALRYISFVSREEIHDYGNDMLEILIEHYGKKHKSEDGVIAAVMREWSIGKQRYPCDKMSLLWKIMYQNHKDVFPNLITLAELASILPIHTEDCKRGSLNKTLSRANYETESKMQP